jgi:hypothetical protein
MDPSLSIRVAEIRAQLQSVADENAKRIEANILALDHQQSNKSRNKRSTISSISDVDLDPSTTQSAVDIAAGLSQFSREQVDGMRSIIRERFQLRQESPLPTAKRSVPTIVRSCASLFFVTNTKFLLPRVSIFLQRSLLRLYVPVQGSIMIS